ncbi:hypothetical protein K501DRAFT_334346 [Backusella circina FSU 941]|nr:hypothetical protein K501DRAFT_334346 [Backusella circina FSU 941]
MNYTGNNDNNNTIKRKRSTNLRPFIHRIKVFIVSNTVSIPNIRRSNTFHCKIAPEPEKLEKTPIRKYYSAGDIATILKEKSRTQIYLTECPKKNIMRKYTRKDFVENWWAYTPPLQTIYF